MKEFDYDLDYKSLDFTDPETQTLSYWKGRTRSSTGSPLYRRHLCHWRFRTADIAVKSSNKIYAMYLDYRDNKDFIGMDMCRKFLEMGFTRSSKI